MQLAADQGKHSFDNEIWTWHKNDWAINVLLLVGMNSALKIMVAGYLLVVTDDKVTSYRYPPTGAPLFFVPRKDFATGHWTLACCLILLLHIILICCSTSYSHNREGCYVPPILCIDLDFSGTGKHKSENKIHNLGWLSITKRMSSMATNLCNVTNCQNQPAMLISPIVKIGKTRLPTAGNCTYPTPLSLLLLPSCIWQRIHVHCPYMSACVWNKIICGSKHDHWPGHTTLRHYQRSN